MKKKIILSLLLIFIVFWLFSLSSQKPEVWQQKCVGCGDCVHYCPVKAISVINGKAIIDHDKCIDCKLCVTSCTFKAIR